MSNKQAIIAIIIMSIATFILRGLPFWLFAKGDKKPPKMIQYLGRVLPYSNIVLLIFYCLKSVELTNMSSSIPAAVGLLIVGILQYTMGKQLLSVALGTGAYVLLLNIL